MATEEDKSIIGIDLGTSFSCVGVYTNGHVEIIPNEQGNRTTPSWVAFTDSDRLIGEAAKNQASLNAKRTIFHVKKLIGSKFEDKEVQRLMKVVPYKIVNIDGKPYIQVEIKDGETEVFSPEEITAMILTKMKETAEAFLGKRITEAVVSVPISFSDEQRQATMDACLIAGFKDVSLILEPAALVRAYGLVREYVFVYGQHNKDDEEKNIVVIDLVDGKCDVTILGVEYGLFDHLAMADLGGKELNNDNDLFMGVMKKAMKDSGLEKHQIDEIILVGASTKVEQLVRDYFNGKVEPKTSVNPDETITTGAAILGDVLARGAGPDPMC
uniref:heat shock 70 kDa protein BIP1-like n=1 Tax=Erigeron canadensis TaxID=72917 RepID=UPI001CB8CA50|nr:heat shock 70 kDa protein BIP1-like [Erigeron canadensis]